MNASLSHVALLVRSAKNSAAFCKDSGFEPGPAEDFPKEGTREVYVGMPANEGLLLLMEAIGPGPYQTALDKRGSGLHHIAINVESVEGYVANLAGSGWLLHPMSLHTLAHQNTVYLARPGLRTLIEVQKQNKNSLNNQDRFISKVFVEGGSEQQRLLDALGIPGLLLAHNEGPGLVIGQKRISIAKLAIC